MEGTKTCIVCHTDCTTKPRIKDPHGRYCCKDCADRKRAAKAVAPQSAATTAQEVVPEEPLLSLDLLAEEAKAQANVASDRVIDLAPAEPNPLKQKKGKAPNLRHAGIDTSRLKPEKCEKCGYDMKGLESLRCPECGAICKPKDKLDYLREESHKLAIKTWLTPIIATVVCLGISMLMLLGMGAPLLVYLFVLVGWLIMIPIGLLAFWVSTLMFLEFDAPWLLTAMRFASIQAFLTIPAVGFLALGFAPGFNIMGIGVGLALMTFIYAWILELEVTDAILLAVVQKVVETAVGTLMLIALENMFGP